MTSILIADDHALIADSLVALLENQPDMEIAATVADGRQAVERCAELTPDLALLDVGLPGLSGVEAAGRIREQCPDTRVLALSMHTDGCYVRAMVNAGALGYVRKQAPAEELLNAVRTVARGKRFFSEGLGYAETDSLGPFDDLSSREREVLQLVVEGRRTADIAERLKISAKTIETYRRQLMNKLGIKSIPELVMYALRHGLVTLEPAPQEAVPDRQNG